MLYVLFCSLFFLITPNYCQEKAVSENSGPETFEDGTIRYILVFDAGSTGTRLNIFKFKYSSKHSTGLTIEKFWDNKSVPGLSAYKRNPWEVKFKIRELLDWSRGIVPSDYYRNTSAIVRATAGLRLMEAKAREAVSKNVIQVLRAFEYVVPERDDRALRVITGREEAEYGWVAVNFLLDSFDDGVDTYGMLDMGGGSTQITFEPQVDGGSRDPFQLEFKTVKGNVYLLHQHSYLGLGGSQAKLYMVGYEDSDPKNKVYETPCLNPEYSGEFSFGSTTITLKGIKTDASKRFEICYQKAVDTIVKLDVHSPPHVKSAKFVAVSQFFYVASNANRVLSLSKTIPGNLSLEFYENAARKLCADPPKTGTYDVYLCMDLVHVIALLKHGYKFRKDQVMFVTNAINGYSTSWALGLAIHYLTCHTPESTKCWKNGGNDDSSAVQGSAAGMELLAMGLHFAMEFIMSSPDL